MEISTVLSAEKCDQLLQIAWICAGAPQHTSMVPICHARRYKPHQWDI